MEDWIVEFGCYRKPGKKTGYIVPQLFTSSEGNKDIFDARTTGTGIEAFMFFDVCNSGLTDTATGSLDKTYWVQMHIPR